MPRDDASAKPLRVTRGEVRTAVTQTLAEAAFCVAVGGAIRNLVG